MICRRTTSLLILALALPTACRSPSLPQVQYQNPDELDLLAGTNLSSADLRAVSRWMADSLRANLGPPPASRPWRVRMESLKKDASLQADPKLVTERLLFHVNSECRGFVDLYLPQGEVKGSHLQKQQQSGVRRGDLPPPGLVVQDLILQGTLREQAHMRTLGLSRYIVFTFWLTDLTGKSVWVESKAIKKRELRHVAFQ